MNIAVSILKKSLHHIFFRIKLKSMDDIWVRQIDRQQ